MKNLFFDMFLCVLKWTLRGKKMSCIPDESEYLCAARVDGPGLLWGRGVPVEEHGVACVAVRAST